MVIKNKPLAFTLIELLVVIAIIGVLSTLAIVALGNLRAKSKDAKRVADLKQIGLALDLYYADNSSYPTIITPGQSLASPDGSRVYLAKIPSNPTPRTDNGAPDLDYIYTVDNTNNPKSYNVMTYVGTGTTSNSVDIVSYSSTGFTCGQKILDINGNQYNTVQIGTQCWMKENLNVGTMVDSINTGSVHSDQTNDDLIEKYCYNNTLSNCDTYGGLYEWQEAMALPNICGTTNCVSQINIPHQGICPTGWHIPTDTEFNTLEQYTVATIGSSATPYSCDTNVIGWPRCADATDPVSNAGGPTGAGKSLKKVGQGSGDDLVGFSALLAGERGTTGSFTNLTAAIYFWQASQNSVTYGYYRGVRSTYSTVGRFANNKAFGLSVRCLKD